MEDKLNPFTDAESDDYDFVLNNDSINFISQNLF